MSVVMTPSEVARLPMVCRHIVCHQRRIEEECSQPIVALDTFKSMKARMRGFVSDAAKMFMPLSIKDGASPSLA